MKESYFDFSCMLTIKTNFRKTIELRLNMKACKMILITQSQKIN